MVTASIRRISLAGDDESLVDLIPKHIHFLPNTAGCQTAKDAILTAELAREALETNWIKLEVIGDRELLYPDTEELDPRDRGAGREGLHRAALLHRGPGGLPQARRCRRRRRDAARRADRLRARHLQSASHRADLRALAGAGRARCRHRHRLRRGARDGARLLGRAAQHRGVEGARSGADGESHARRRSRPGGWRGSPDAFRSSPTPSRRARNSAWSAREARLVIASCRACETGIHSSSRCPDQRFDASATTLMAMKLPNPAAAVTDRRRRGAAAKSWRRSTAGCRWVSVREKDLSDDEQIALARTLAADGAASRRAPDAARRRRRCAQSRGADGVHLPAGSDPRPPRADARTGKLIGVSIHTVDRGRGDRPAAPSTTRSPGRPIETASKPGYGPEIGPQRARRDRARRARADPRHRRHQCRRASPRCWRPARSASP